MEELQTRFGLCLSNKGLELCEQDCQDHESGNSPDDLFQMAILRDLKEIASPVLKKLLDNPEIEEKGMFSGKLFLQVASVKNGSQTAKKQFVEQSSDIPRMIVLQLTDGFSKVTACEFIPFKSYKIADFVPGTKVVIQDFSIFNGIILLKDENIVKICGEVEDLKESWIVQQKLQTLRSFDSSNATSLAPGEDPPPKFEALVLSNKKEANEEKKEKARESKGTNSGKVDSKKTEARKHSEKNKKSESSSSEKKNMDSNKSSKNVGTKKQNFNQAEKDVQERSSQQHPASEEKKSSQQVKKSNDFISNNPEKASKEMPKKNPKPERKTEYSKTRKDSEDGKKGLSNKPQDQKASLSDKLAVDFASLNLESSRSSNTNQAKKTQSWKPKPKETQ